LIRLAPCPSLNRFSLMPSPTCPQLPPPFIHAVQPGGNMQGHRAQRTVLECEPLEGRDCPAVITFGGTLLVLGTAGADTVDITDDGAGNLSVTLNGTTQTAKGIKAVAVLTGGGDDTVTYTLTGDQTGVRAIGVDTGTGNDTVTLNAGNIGGYFAFAAT